MAYSTIKADLADDGLATLTLARPEAGNGIDLQLAKDLSAVTTEWAVDRRVRAVLLTGEAVNEADKAAVEQAVQRIENVRSTVNELAVAIPSAMSTRSNDALITGKVKATFIDAKDLQVNAFKVVTERGNVYLMGRVTEREAARATDLARTVSGVQKVVRVFDIVTEQELADMAPPKK